MKSNLSELFKTLKEYEGTLQDVPVLVADEILARTKQRTPVQSGSLRDSWSISINTSNIVISSDLEYAGFVEYGTINMSPVRMMTRSVDEADDILKGVLASKGIAK